MPARRGDGDAAGPGSAAPLAPHLPPRLFPPRESAPQSPHPAPFPMPSTLSGSDQAPRIPARCRRLRQRWWCGLSRDPGGGAGRGSRAGGGRGGGKGGGGCCRAGGCTSICWDRGVRGAIFVSNKRCRGRRYTEFPCKADGWGESYRHGLPELPRGGRGNDGPGDRVALSNPALAVVRARKGADWGSSFKPYKTNDEVRGIPRATCFSQKNPPQLKKYCDRGDSTLWH